MRVEPTRRSQPLRAAFVMEQALGHVTHYRNVRQVVDHEPSVSPTWLPIPYEVVGAARLVPMLRSNWSVRASWRARRALQSMSATSAFDAVFFHSQVTSLFSLDVMHRVPSVISLDATPINYDSVAEPYGHRPAGNSVLDRQKYQLNRRAFHAADGLVTWSDWARRSLADDYGVDSDKVRVLAPGACSKYFDIGRSRLAAAARDSDRLRILFVGGDFKRKGGQLLLDLMRGPLGRTCELHIVTRATVPPQANVFVYSGIEPNSEPLLRLFANADLFVLPTYADCLAVVLEEAAAAALPVITTSVGALAEGVEEGESGLMVPAGDRRALEAAISALVDDAPRRERMARAAHALACRAFDADRNNRALLDYLHQVVESRRISRRAA
ncbi:MAG TPA: glycosyltransferase family 4 protein [Chloroflexota bacterium]